MKFLNTAKKAAALFNEDAIIEYETPPVTDAIVSEIPNGWVHLGERNGKPHYRTTPGVAVSKPAVNPVLDILMTLPVENSRHIEGGTCPHCEGIGRYSAHRGHFNNEKCFRCHGKGTLDAKDIAYLERRRQGAGPLCHIKTA